MRDVMFMIMITLSFLPQYAVAAVKEQAPSTQGYETAMDKMHHQMMIPYTGDADKDFVAGMIPHHQGAIDMAEIEVKYGKDPEIKEMAENIIKAQKSEIRMMQDWQKEHANK